MKNQEIRLALSRRGRGERAFTTLEVLIALVLVVLVVVFTGRMIVTTFAIIGRGNDFEGERAARARSEGVAWVQAVAEYARKVGFDGLTTALSCCSFWISSSSTSPPFDGVGGPALPLGFQCGHVLLSDWPPEDPDTVRLVTIEIYRVKPVCNDSGSEQPYIAHQTALADR